MKNILVSTYGTTWHLIAEILGLTNPCDLPFYDNHPAASDISDLRRKYSIEPVSEIWLITTAGTIPQDTYETYRKWHQTHFPAITIHSIWSGKLSDLHTGDDCRKMRDLIFRTVLAAHDASAGGQVILSMVGGFKTMGADIQEASNVFGCSALMHILLNGKVFNVDPLCFEKSLPMEQLSMITPIVVSGRKNKAAYLYKSSEITSEKYPVLLDEDNCVSTDLLDKISEYQTQAEVVLSNFAQYENKKKIVGNFRALAGLHPKIIDHLQNAHIGIDIDDEKRDLEWLQKLPKAELHCHFGGILTPAEMIVVAQAEEERVKTLRSDYPAFDQYLTGISRLVNNGSQTELRKRIRDKKSIRKPLDPIPEPYGVCGFLQQFVGKSELLEQVIFNDYIDPEFYQMVGIEKYEKLGDLQGSALMQSENCIRAACHLLIEHCCHDNIQYLELRCSPMNYTRGDLSGMDVVRILLDELSGQSDVYVTLLFIASRHGKMSDIYRHIELAEELFSPHEGWADKYVNLFKERFVGFDLAGAETVRSPKELREAFETLHKRCLNLTIHAGETAKAESIWEAVYYLNADRIGHGLKLLEQPDLLNRFVDHRIAVEMCPSSNFQICGFADRAVPNSENLPQYPLTEYLRQGLRVTINTDNPGISRTNLSNEYLKAARMSPDGISRWDILQLINNSFTVTFAPFKLRREMILKAEQSIMKLIEDDYGLR